MTICVLDDGCRMDHHDFNGEGKFRDWAYFDGQIWGGYVTGKKLVTSSDSGANPARMYQKGSDHGTACCGVAAAGRDSVLTVGVAPDCRLLPIKVLSDEQYLYFDDKDFLAILNFISDKADVMSNSWGRVPTRTFPSQILDRIEWLRTRGGRSGNGLLVLFAAGNENCPINYTASIKVPYDHGWKIQPNRTYKWVGVSSTEVFKNDLADHPGVLHVAALASTARRSHYSNYGPGIDICAPTSNSHTYHRMTVQGLGITTTEGTTPIAVTAEFGGTSSATPLVAGIAALVFSANPDLTADGVRQILLDTASQDLDETPYPQTPPASYDSDTSWDVSPISPFRQRHVC